MAKFDIGETVICSCEVKNTSGTLVDPATSMKIVIKQIKPNYSIIVSSTDMTRDSTGKYHYDFDSAGKSDGEYQAIYTATDGSRVTIEKDIFNLE